MNDGLKALALIILAPFILATAFTVLGIVKRVLVTLLLLIVFAAVELVRFISTPFRRKTFNG